jgi:peptidoglycan glycosyltransferase
VNRPIRAFGGLIMVLFLVLVAQLVNLQVVQADHFNRDPRNNRNAIRDFSRNRGAIQTADGVVIARSVPSKDSLHYQRQYPLGRLFPFVTGYQSFLYGTDGVELQYGAELAGRNLPLRVHDLSRFFDSTQRTANVTLTLTAALQEVATAALGSRTGAVVALDPNTGAILALVSQPTYDPNELASHDGASVRRSWNGLNADINRPLLARAYRERYPPGSTFKVVTSSAALDHDPALATKSYPVTSSLVLPQTTHTLHNFGGEACGGTLLDRILRISCDTAFGQMGLDLGGPNLSGEANAFGFGSKPPLDLGPVAASQFPDAASFVQNRPALAFSAIGQENVASTPLQMALVASAIADHGTIMRPHVMASITDNDGRLVRTYQPAQWIQATSPQTADAVRGLMVSVVSGVGGTGTGVAIPGVQVAAKTGTAEVDGVHTDAWMIAFAPADAPKIAVAVVLPRLTGIGNETTGGVVAAPIVRQIITAFLGAKP